jgi:tetratricopeptide (TPR) repeat protein
MKRLCWHRLGILFSLLLLNGCTGVALNVASSLVPNLTGAFFEECDLELARQSLPAQLKLMEGLLKGTPENTAFLTALSMGFTGYAMLFVEDEAPGRASRLYLRARAYGLKAIGVHEPTPQTIQARLKTIDQDTLAPLFWVAMSWHGWINLNLDDPAALGQLGAAQACLERVLEIEPNYFYGAPYLLAGSMLAARPQMLGGDADRAKDCFSRAMAVSNGAFFLAPYYYARYYAVRVQDRKLFLDLLSGIVNGRADQLKEVCLINTAIQEKAQGLIEKADDLFF